MNGGKIAGILIIIIMILSIAVLGYNSIIKNNDDEVSTTLEILDESEINQTFTEEDTNSSIETINININQKTGGSKIQFADNTSTIYNITSTYDEDYIQTINTNNKKNTTVTTNQNGTHLDVNIETDEAQNTIILSNKYNYTINGEIVSGGFIADLANNAKVDELNINITAGGLDLELNGGQLSTVNSKITTGGVNIVGEPKGVTTINSEIEVGGLNLQTEKAIADIFSEIEVGGLNPGEYQQVGNNEYKGNSFDSSENKIIINNNIRLGGLNTQSF